MQVLEKGSNEYYKAQDLIAKFELLLSEIKAKEIMLSEEQPLTFETSRHAIFQEYSVSVPSALQCSGDPGNI